VATFLGKTTFAIALPNGNYKQHKCGTQTEGSGVMKFNRSDSHSHRWAFILAGGDGKRLLPLTRRIAGDDRPKQFCAVLGEETLLHQTQRRVSRLVQSWRTVLVLTKTHEPFYADEVAGIPSSRLLIQPFNQGTAPAILYSVLRLCEMDPKGVVAFFPSDHHFSDDEAFIGHIESAYDVATSRPEVVILLGIPPESPEVEYGWIEPGIPLGSHVPGNIYRVSRFWEKPSTTLAATLMERGCLWNSFVMIGHVQAFLNLMRNALPRLVEAFESIRSSFFTAYERPVLSDLYLGVRAASFSQDVLSARPNDLAVLRATGLGWSDLGEPGRLLSVLQRKGVQTDLGVQAKLRKPAGNAP
jgi:mannose-1-phosphate guanylyltransferase